MKPQVHSHAREQTSGQARANANAAQAGVEKLADVRQQATGDGWKSVESGLNAASQSLQNASDRLARTLGFSGSAHYWGREITKLGHTVKLIAPAYVKPPARQRRPRGHEWHRRLAPARTLLEHGATLAGEDKTRGFCQGSRQPGCRGPWARQTQAADLGPLKPRMGL